MSVRFILSVFAFGVLICDIVKCDAEGFYWRDFTGKIPSDALPGGRDVEGKPIFIAQVLNSKLLIPAKVYENDRKAYYELGEKEYSATNNVKILCTQHPEQFEWIKTNNDEIQQITDKQLVIGGFEPGYTTYIGRARHAGEISVGKVIDDSPSYVKGIHVTSGGKGFRYTSYEVLAFNPKIGGTDVRNSNVPRNGTTTTINVFL